MKAIVRATYTHSRNLAYFVFTYKGLLALQSRMQGKKIPFHSFLAACIGGWLVFGENNNINSQVNDGVVCFWVYTAAHLMQSENQVMLVIQVASYLTALQVKT